MSGIIMEISQMSISLIL
ncbi:hypothetical protein Gorai_007529 [Gossypium raimondii]|uniref:Uncharacterized protein n=1 Tax=Gossypium raimondii TaxID=29730 RepID=A0A7J8Q869_GOSRA|nr:hypothetical protein [Gossypium raimondii]